MNKTFNINLGGYPFAIDENAFNYVQQYLEKIRQHFSTSESCDEILYDIEVRMAELFQEHLKGRSIVSMKEVDEIVMIMGKPEDFGAQPMDETHTQTKQNGSTQSNKSKTNYGTGKRLFRDTEDKKVGGVCSGVAAYFGVEDPLWVRLIFVAFFFIGVSPVVYFVLWVLVPEALTSSDKLAMRGEPTTINNIAKVIETELTDLGHRINEWGNEINEEFGSKSKDKKKSSDMRIESSAHKFVSGGVNVIGSATSMFTTVLSSIFKGSFKVIAIILVFALAIAWFASLFGVSWATPFFVLAGPKNAGLTYLGIISGLVFVLLPVIGLIFMVVRLAWGYRINANLKSGLWVVWFLSIFTASFTGMKTAREYQSGYDNSQKDIITISDPTIYLSSLPYHTNEMGVSIGNFMYERENGYVIRGTNVTLEKSPDQNIYIEKLISARGQTSKDAQVNSLVSANQYTVVGNKITFDPFTTIPKSSRYRGQDIDYVLYIPVGRKIVVDENFREVAHGSSDFIPWDQMHEDGVNTWTVTENGTTSSQYEDKVNHTRVIDNLNFSKLILDYGFDVEIRQGATSSVTLVGDKELVNDHVEVKNIGGMLTIIGDKDEHDRMGHVKLIIETAKELEMIQLDDIYKLRMKGIDQKHLQIICTGDYWQDSEIRFEGQVQNLSVSLADEQKITLFGSGDKLTLDLKDDAIISADKYIVKEAKLISGENMEWSESKIHVTNDFTQNTSSETIVILGSPVKHIPTSKDDK
jgi:phage shock protein PspC (stress-responsive transcriptional regulator)